MMGGVRKWRALSILIGVDIGTSSVKAAAFDALTRRVLARADVPHAVHAPRPGWAEQDANDWLAGTYKALSAVTSDIPASGVRGIGIAGQSWACVPVDAKGVPLARTPIWLDTRASMEAEAINRAGGGNLFPLAGNRAAPGHSGPKALWMKKHAPGVYQSARWMMQSNSFIALRLTGVPSADRSLGYGWACYNMSRGEYDNEMARELGLPLEKLPPLYNSSDVVGRVTADAARVTGLPEGTPVVAGGLDAACGTLGVGVVHAGQTQEQGGQAGGFSACLDSPKAHPALILSAHVVPGLWLLQGGTVGGAGAMRWGQSLFKESYSELDQKAARTAAGAGGVTFLPYLSGERSPLWDPNARGVFFGMTYATDSGTLWRAILEGVACSLHHNLETARAAGVAIGTLRSTGGSSRSAVTMQIKADITGKTMEVALSEDATSLGAAILAGVGTGVYGDFSEASAGARLSERYEPNPDNRTIYARGYQRYLALYRALAPIMHEGVDS